MDLVKCIEKTLEELESSGNRKAYLAYELFVLSKFLCEDYKILGFRKRFLGVEIDLLVESKTKSRIYLMEIKSEGRKKFLAHRISKKQLNRQKRVLDFCAQKYKKPVEYWHVFYSASAQLRFEAKEFWF